MRNMTVVLLLAGVAMLAGTSASSVTATQAADRTTVTPWPDDRRGAVSITFDDSSINQFRVAAPLLDERRLPGTFFVITGGVIGSSAQARFVGRAPAEILRESA